MSFGSISREAHTTLAAAMNAIGEGPTLEREERKDLDLKNKMDRT